MKNFWFLWINVFTSSRRVSFRAQFHVWIRSTLSKMEVIFVSSWLYGKYSRFSSTKLLNECNGEWIDLMMLSTMIFTLAGWTLFSLENWKLLWLSVDITPHIPNFACRKEYHRHLELWFTQISLCLLMFCLIKSVHEQCLMIKLWLKILRWVQRSFDILCSANFALRVLQNSHDFAWVLSNTQIGWVEKSHKSSLKKWVWFWLWVLFDTQITKKVDFWIPKSVSFIKQSNLCTPKYTIFPSLNP